MCRRKPGLLADPCRNGHRSIGFSFFFEVMFVGSRRHKFCSPSMGPKWQHLRMLNILGKSPGELGAVGVG
jgi:hypothetical protein